MKKSDLYSASNLNLVPYWVSILTLAAVLAFHLLFGGHV